MRHTSCVLAASLLAAVLLLGSVADAKKKAKDPETCEDKIKSLGTASKALIPEIEDLKPLVKSLDNSELSRVWRLYRNQQAQVDAAFRDVANEFSRTTRDRAGIATLSPKGDTDRLGEVFFSGQPYFVQCADESEPLHRAFTDSAALLAEAGVTPAALDCTERYRILPVLPLLFDAGSFLCVVCVCVCVSLSLSLSHSLVYCIAEANKAQEGSTYTSLDPCTLLLPQEHSHPRTRARIIPENVEMVCDGDG